MKKIISPCGHLTKSQKNEMSAPGKLLIVKIVGSSDDNLYVVKSVEKNPLKVLVHTARNALWQRDEFRIAWTETVQYQNDAHSFLQEMQNRTHVYTGLKELDADANGFHNLTLCIPFCL